MRICTEIEALHFYLIGHLSKELVAVFFICVLLENTPSRFHGPLKHLFIFIVFARFVIKHKFEWVCENLRITQWPLANF